MKTALRLSLLAAPLLLSACKAEENNPLFCKEGNCSYDLIATCSTDGKLVAIKADTLELSERAPIGFVPQSLARMRDVILVGDVNEKLGEVRISDFRALAETNKIGSSPNHILVSGDTVFLVDSFQGNNLQVLSAPASSAAVTADSGLGLATIGQLFLGENSSPQAIAKVGDTLYITLGGGYTGPESIAAGQKIAKVDVKDPTNPTLLGTIDLSGLDLHSPSANKTVARPASLLERNGKLYVALGNTAEDFGGENGPPLLAVVELKSEAVSTISLDAERCANPIGLAVDGENLFVSCSGNAVYGGPPDYAFVSADKTALLMLDGSDAQVGAYTPACPADRAGCQFPVAGKISVFNHQVFVGDQNGGNIYVADTAGGRLTERAVVAACPPESKSFSNVLDILPLP